jgi:hypothetical protein
MRAMTEHLVFAALMVPTFVVLAAAAVSLAHADPKVLEPVALLSEAVEAAPF